MKSHFAGGPIVAGDAKMVNWLGNSYLDSVATKKVRCKDQESIQSSTTPDPRYQWESDKLTVIHHKRELRGQPFPSK